MKPLQFRELIRHPITLAIGGFASATTLVQIKALTIIGAYFWAHLGEVFTITSLAGFTVAPNVAFVPEGPLIVFAVLTGIAYGVKKLYEMYTDLDRQLDSKP